MPEQHPVEVTSERLDEAGYFSFITRVNGGLDRGFWNRDPGVRRPAAARIRVAQQEVLERLMPRDAEEAQPLSVARALVLEALARDPSGWGLDDYFHAFCSLSPLGLPVRGLLDKAKHRVIALHPGPRSQLQPRELAVSTWALVGALGSAIATVKNPASPAGLAVLAAAVAAALDVAARTYHSGHAQLLWQMYVSTNAGSERRVPKQALLAHLDSMQDAERGGGIANDSFDELVSRLTDEGLIRDDGVMLEWGIVMLG